MPELPEVEVVKRSLTRKVQNLIIQKVNIKAVSYTHLTLPTTPYV